MSSLYWDTSLPAQGGGTPQTLELNGYTLSLVPNGGSVQLPQNISTVGPNGYISTLGVLNELDVGPGSNVRILSSGQVYLSSVYGSLGNFFTVNANDVLANDVIATNVNASNGNFNNLNVTNLNPSTVIADQIFTSSIIVGNTAALTIGQDYGPNSAGGSRISQQYNKIGIDATVTMKPGKAINTDLLNAGVITADYTTTPGLSVSSINMNNNLLSNTANYLTFNGSNIYPGQRGDASQWAAFPASQTVNANNQTVGNVGTLNVNQTANLGNNLGATVNMLNNDSGFFPPAGSLNVGFGNSTNPTASQPDINLNGRTVNIAAGASINPTYAAGRTVNIDAYAGLFPQIIPPFQPASSYINLTAHANSFGGACNTAGCGNIVLTAFNNYLGPIPNPLAPGRIYLNASKVDIGNANYTGLGESAIINLQAAQIQLIAGLTLPGPFNNIPALAIRSAGGVTIYNDPLGNNNRDSRLYVREITGYSNFVNDFGPAALTLDGSVGGLTLNNFLELNGQPGAALNNVATMSGAYATNVQNQIDALQSAITNISTTGGTSNLALWFQYPALSTVTFNKDINLLGGSISTSAGVVFNDTAGNLTNTYQKRVYIDGKTPMTGSTMMFYDASAVSFVNPSSLAYNDLRGQGFYFGSSNYLNVSSGYLQFNGQNLISTSGGGGGGGIVGANLTVSSLTAKSFVAFPRFLPGSVNYFSNAYYSGSVGDAQDTTLFNEFGATGDLGVSGVKFGQTGGVYPFGKIVQHNDGIMVEGYNGAGSTTTTYIECDSNGFALRNLSSINGLPLSSFTGGGGGVSSIQNWSFYPATSGEIQFGTQSALIKGDGSALFTTSNGADTVDVVARAFTAFDANNIGVISQFGLGSNGIPGVFKNSAPTGFQVSTLNISSGVLSFDGQELLLNGSNIVSSNAANWYNYPARSTVTIQSGVFPGLGGKNDAVLITNTSGQYSNISPFLEFSTVGTSMFINANQGYGNFQLYGSNATAFVFYDDVQIPNGSLFTTSTITNNIALNSNALTASNGALFFNGQQVGVSSSTADWSQFPAVSQIDSAYPLVLSNANALSYRNFQENFSSYAYSTIITPSNITLETNAPVASATTLTFSNVYQRFSIYNSAVGATIQVTGGSNANAGIDVYAAGNGTVDFFSPVGLTRSTIATDFVFQKGLYLNSNNSLFASTNQLFLNNSRVLPFSFSAPVTGTAVQSIGNGSPTSVFNGNTSNGSFSNGVAYSYSVPISITNRQNIPVDGCTMNFGLIVGGGNIVYSTPVYLSPPTTGSGSNAQMIMTLTGTVVAGATTTGFSIIAYHNCGQTVQMTTSGGALYKAFFTPLST